MTFPYDSEGRYLDSDRDAGREATKEPMLQRGDIMDELQSRTMARWRHAGGSRDVQQMPQKFNEQFERAYKRAESLMRIRVTYDRLGLDFDKISENACMWPGDEELLNDNSTN